MVLELSETKISGHPIRNSVRTYKMLYLNYTKINNGLEIWIDFAANARSYLVTGAIPTNLTNISQILDYCKVPPVYEIISKPLLIYIGFMLILMIVTIFGGLFQCFGQCCCKGKILKKQVEMKRHSKRTKLVVGLIFGIIFLYSTLFIFLF